MRIAGTFSIKVAKNRIRKVFNQNEIEELALDIQRNGLYHAPIVRREGKDLYIVAGERRLRAMKYLQEKNVNFFYDGEEFEFEEYKCPVTHLTDLPESRIHEIELHENLLRSDLTWKEVVEARVILHELRMEEAEKEGEDWTMTKTAIELAALSKKSVSRSRAQIADALLIKPFLKESLLQNAKTEKDAKKLVLRQMEGEFLQDMEKFQKEEQKKIKRAMLDEGKSKAKIKEEMETLTARPILNRMTEERFKSLGVELTCKHGDFRDIELPEKHFQMVIADPPYGIDAQNFGDAAGSAHNYDDSKETGFEITEAVFRDTLPAHDPEGCWVLCFCDVQYFADLVNIIKKYPEYSIWPRPLIWDKINAGHVPHIAAGRYLRRQYETIILAWTGNPKTQDKVFGDIFHRSNFNVDISHPAKKPPNLFTDFIDCFGGGKIKNVLDPCCGGGSIFPAAVEAKVSAWGIEIDEKYYQESLRVKEKAWELLT